VELSTATQVESGLRCAERLGFTAHREEDVYVDGGMSGMGDDRPQYRELMMKIFSPERPYSALIVDDISRLSRRSSNYINYEEIFAEEGIELISLMDPPGNPQVKIDTGRRMKAVMNEAQVVDSAVKTRNSQMFAVEMGFYIGWIQPFGV
jgi:DNA invertase Pin-like site-specific DNA recombinase